MKHCRWCSQDKPLDDFYTHPRMADGHLNKCKECHAEAVRLHRATDPKVQEDERRRYRDGRKRIKQPAQRDVIADRARSAVSNAIRDGKLKRGERCEECGRSDVYIEGAHHDYDRPLAVRWLCRRCHRLWDRAEPKRARLAS